MTKPLPPDDASQADESSERSATLPPPPSERDDEDGQLRDAAFARVQQELNSLRVSVVSAAGALKGLLALFVEPSDEGRRRTIRVQLHYIRDALLGAMGYTDRKLLRDVHDEYIARTWAHATATIDAASSEAMRKLLERITVDPAVCDGRPCVRGKHAEASFVLERAALGASVDQLCEVHDLSAEEVKACFAYGAQMIHVAAPGPRPDERPTSRPLRPT